MKNENVALVALLRTPPQKVSWRKLTEQVLECGSAVEVWDQYNPQQLIPSPDAEKALADAEADLASWSAQGLQFLTVLDADYPQRLLDILETPPYLFAQGRLVADDLGVSVVGSRAASPRGLEMAAGIASHVAERGLTVISGMAAGVDTAAHHAAIAAGGRTVAFIATGSNRTYPATNRALHASIADTGLVLSQFWPDSPPQKHHFLMRNALMSGYGLATIVVEAGETSGARAQARMAVEHGRPVILTDRVVSANQWAQKMVSMPGVSVASSVGQIDDIISALIEQPDRTNAALRTLAFTSK